MTTTTPHHLVPCTCGHRAGDHELHIGGSVGTCEHCDCREFTAAPCPADACPDCHHRWTDHTPRPDGQLVKEAGGCYHRIDRFDDHQSVDRPGYDGEKWCPCRRDADGVDRVAARQARHLDHLDRARLAGEFLYRDLDGNTTRVGVRL